MTKQSWKTVEEYWQHSNLETNKPGIWLRITVGTHPKLYKDMLTWQALGIQRQDDIWLPLPSGTQARSGVNTSRLKMCQPALSPRTRSANIWEELKSLWLRQLGLCQNSNKILQDHMTNKQKGRPEQQHGNVMLPLCAGGVSKAKKNSFINFLVYCSDVFQTHDQTNPKYQMTRTHIELVYT